MKKRLISIITLLVLSISLVFGLASCKKEEPQDPEEPQEIATLKFYVSDDGWGTDGYQAIVDAFNKKAEAEYYGFKIEIDSSSDKNSVLSDFNKGVSKMDILATSSPSHLGQEYLEPLNDVLDGKYGNESKTLRQKFDTEELAMMEKEDSIAMLPIASQVGGIVYNKALFAEGDFDVPLTTNELIALCTNPDFNNPTHRAWIHFANIRNGYYSYVMNVWTAQYMGYENYVKLQNIQSYTNHEGYTVTGSKNILTTEDGRYKTLKVLDDMLNYNNVADGSILNDNITQQIAFLNGKAMMMVNGSWLGAEMLENGGGFDGTKFDMMKTPVISSIIETLPNKSISTDAKLHEVIEEIDAGKNFSQANLSFSCSEADYNRVKEARNMMASVGCSVGMYMPSCSTKKAEAKQFIQYFYSDEAMQIWASVNRNELSTTYSDENIPNNANYYDGWSAWDKSVKEHYQNAGIRIGEFRSRSDFYVKNNLSIFIDIDCIGPFSVMSAAKNWQTVWSKLQQRVYGNNWAYLPE